MFSLIDCKTICHTCNIVSNSTMSELSADDIRAKEALHNTLRH